MKPITSDMKFKGFEWPALRVTKLAGGLTALGLTAITCWTLGSGLSHPPDEIFTSRTNVELYLPYRGVCRELTVFSNGEELPTGYKDIKSGLARFSIDLGPGEHQLQVCFSTIVPGWNRTYDLVVEVDQIAPRPHFSRGVAIPCGRQNLDDRRLGSLRRSGRGRGSTAGGRRKPGR